MNYTIKKLETILENGVATKQLLTLEVSYENTARTSQHNKVIPLEANPKEEAIIYAAELELILEEPKEITTEEVEVLEKDKEVKAEHIQAKLLEANEPVVEPKEE